jgi:hypothetical protein
VSTVYTIDGPSSKGKKGKTCKRVRMGKRGCTIETCRSASGRGRWKFQKGTMRCGR